MQNMKADFKYSTTYLEHFRLQNKIKIIKLTRRIVFYHNKKKMHSVVVSDSSQQTGFEIICRIKRLPD